MATQFKKGDVVCFKTNTSRTGKYKDYIGMHGTIIIPGGTWDQSVNQIRLTDGTILRYVGYRVLQHYYAAEKHTSANAKTTLLAEQKNLLRKLNFIDEQLKFLEETKSDQFDMTEFTIYKTLQTLNESGASDLDKSKELAKILRKG